MASVIYPGNTMSGFNFQTEKLVLLENNLHSTFPHGHIIAKGNRIEGIEALE